MAGRGGARPGAGRKPKREKHVNTVQDAEQRIRDRLPLIIDKLFVLAEGVTVQDIAADGSTDVYTEAPSFKALEYLCNRVLGKPIERHKLSGDDDSPIKVIVEYADADPHAAQTAPGAAADPE